MYLAFWPPGVHSHTTRTPLERRELEVRVVTERTPGGELGQDPEGDLTMSTASLRTLQPYKEENPVDSPAELLLLETGRLHAHNQR